MWTNDILAVGMRFPWKVTIFREENLDILGQKVRADWQKYS